MYLYFCYTFITCFTLVVSAFSSEKILGLILLIFSIFKAHFERYKKDHIFQFKKIF